MHTLIFKSKFLQVSILNKQRFENSEDEITLDYSRFKISTVKWLVDALYNCNSDIVPVDELLKILQLVWKFGFLDVLDGKEEFPCTRKE